MRELSNQFTDRPFCSLIYVEKGQLSYMHKNKTFYINENHFGYIPSEITYSYKNTSKSEISQIDFSLYYNLCNVVLFDKPTDLGEISITQQNIINNIIATDKSEKLLITGLILILLANTFSKPKHKIDKRIIPAINHINQNFNQKIYIVDLAEMCHLSRAQFERIFKSNLGTTPIKYKNNLIISEAKKLLKYSSLSINEISSQLGFNDSYSFCHLFKNTVSKTPKNYRKFFMDEKIII